MDSRLQLLVVTLEGRRFALHLAVVERVLRMVDVTPLPGAPDVVEGVVNVHGDVVPAVSLRRRLGLEKGAPRVSDSLVLAHTPKRRLALIVDSVTEVIERAEADVVSAAAIVSGAEHIEGVLKTRDGLILIQDLDKFLSLEEEQSLARAMEGS